MSTETSNNTQTIKLAVCVPVSWSSVSSEFFISYTALFAPSQLASLAKAGVSRLWHLVDRAFPLDLCRNRLARKALELGATRILFLDADMTFPKKLVERLLKARADVAGALYFKKMPPFQPVPSNFDSPDDYQLMRPIKLPEKGRIVKCDVLGMGATLIGREVFETVKEPWFAYDVYRKTGEASITEDVTFCRKTRQHGFNISCDTRLVCGHIRTDIAGPEHWEAFRDEFE